MGAAARAAALALAASLLCSLAAASDVPTEPVPLLMKSVTVPGDDTYMACSTALPRDARHIVRFEPRADMNVVHHMLLYLCTGEPLVSQASGVLQAMHQLCPAGQMLSYGWGRNAPPLSLPPGVGFEVGAASGFTHAVLQMHYLRPPNASTTDGKDSSGVIMHLTEAPTPRAAGILMFASSFTIPARAEDHKVVMECCYEGPQPLNAVAFRVHTHTLGRLVTLDRIALGAGGSVGDAPLLRRSPLLPQAFALVADQPGARNPGGGEEGGGDAYINAALPGPLVIRPGQRLRATCRFNASTSDHDVRAGATSADEMCNLYLLFDTVAPTALGCYDFLGREVHTESGPLPPAPGGDTRLAPLPHAWAPPPALGQLGGGDLSPDAARLWLFHRGGRTWTADAFDAGSHTMPADAEPVSAAAVVALDPGSGAELASFGAGVFMMPHGLSTDAWGNLWITDVGLHQVFKYSETGQRLLALGAPRSPGGGGERFCQPAAAVAASDGSSFVADGYCGARVAAFHPNGTFRGEWAPSAAGGAGARPLRVPHALALDDCAGLLHVADRENGRVLTLAGVAGPPDAWTLHGEWDTSAIGLPYALTRTAGGDVFALLWARDSSGAVTLARLGDGRAARAAPAPPAATWPLPGVASPHVLVMAAGPGGGGQVLWVGETRPQGGAPSTLHRLSLGDVDTCPWEGCGGGLARMRAAPGVGAGYIATAAQRRRVLMTRLVLVGTIALLIAAAVMPGSRGARMLGAGRGSGGGGAGGSAGGAAGAGAGGEGRRGRKARQSMVGAPDVPPTPTGPAASAPPWAPPPGGAAGGALSEKGADAASASGRKEEP